MLLIQLSIAGVVHSRQFVGSNMAPINNRKKIYKPIPAAGFDGALLLLLELVRKNSAEFALVGTAQAAHELRPEGVQVRALRPENFLQLSWIVQARLATHASKNRSKSLCSGFQVVLCNMVVDSCTIMENRAVSSHDCRLALPSSWLNDSIKTDRKWNEA